MASEPELRFLGEATLYNPSTEEPVTVVYRYTFNEDTFQGHLEITPKDPHSTVKPYSHYPEAKKQKLETLAHQFMGHVLNNTIHAKWTQDTLIHGTTIYAINAHNEICPIFQAGSWFGCTIAHTDKQDPTPQILVKDWKHETNQYVLKLFKYDPRIKKYVATKELPTEKIHSYNLI